jgi:hypothetical protein
MEGISQKRFSAFTDDGKEHILPLKYAEER